MKSHSQKVGEECVKRAKGKYGVAWRYLSEEQQKGAIAYEVLSVALSCFKHHRQSVANRRTYSGSLTRGTLAGSGKVSFAFALSAGQGNRAIQPTLARVKERIKPCHLKP